MIELACFIISIASIAPGAMKTGYVMAAAIVALVLGTFIFIAFGEGSGMYLSGMYL
jgi:hypothetical protein